MLCEGLVQAQITDKQRTGTLSLHRCSPAETCVLGYECGKVFAAGVGPDSPSRDVAN